MTLSVLPRVIPVLLVSDGYLVKPTKFAKPGYVGDPINAVKIFNEKEVDELVIVDIDATRNGGRIDERLIEDVASEAFMPVAYGGGVSTAEQAARIVATGIEKVVLGSVVHRRPDAVTEIAEALGSSSTVVSVDVRRKLGGRQRVHVENGRVDTGADPVAWARRAEELGAGELLVQSIDRESTSSGYDLDLVRSVSDAVSVPIVALGGAADLSDLRGALDAGASGAAAGTMFVLNGKHRAVLITYPSPDEVRSLAVRS